jgi:hypothetical protein
MRAALVAVAGAALGLLALANLSISVPPRAQAGREAQLRAPILAPLVSSFAIVSRVDDFSR